MKVGVCVAVYQGDQILLTKRMDFGVWCLPGGLVEEGETVVQAAVRETAEETGLQVQLTRQVGIYSIPEAVGWVNLMILFAGEIVGGSLQAQEDEVVEMRFFRIDEIPQDLLWGHHRRILDAFAGYGGGVVRRQHVPFGAEIGRQELYQMRDASGLSGFEFYRQHFGWADPDEDQEEIPGTFHRFF